MLAWSAVSAKPVLAAPGVADAAATTITGPGGSVSVDGPATITVQARDDTPANMPGGGDAVTLSSSLDGALAVTDVGDGTYTATLNDTAPRTHIISGTINGNAITSGNATVNFVPGAADPAETTIDAAPPTIDTDVATSDITVTARDQFGNQLTTGGDAVTLNSDNGNVPDPDDNIDGTYSAVLTDTVTRTDTVTGTINGDAITDDATVDFTPGALHHFVFNAIGAQVAGAPFSVTVTAYDQNNNVKTDYSGGAALSGLAASPGCSGCSPTIAASQPTTARSPGTATASAQRLA